MGWHASSDPRRREIDIRRNEAESYKQVDIVVSLLALHYLCHCRKWVKQKREELMSIKI